MTDWQRVPNPLAAINRLPAGSGVIFRHYEAETKIKIAHAVKDLCNKNNLLLIVAGDYDLASNIDADGLHLPEFILHNPPLNVRLWQRSPTKLLTATAHSLISIRKCAALGVDAALVSPVFPTASHPETNFGKQTLGALGLTRMSRSSPVPVYALGGITQQNAAQLLKTPARGIAGISGIADNDGA